MSVINLRTPPGHPGTNVGTVTSGCRVMDLLEAAPPIWHYRFWSQVDVGRASHCWNWNGNKNGGRGYGRLKMPSGGGWVFAHRVAYCSHHAAPLGALLACHRCDNPACCNPFHIYAGDHSENTADRMEKKTTRDRLSDEEVATIRSLCAQGLSNSEVAELYSLSQGTVSRLKSGKRR